MNNLKDSLLLDIRTGLLACWMKAKEASINGLVNAIPGTDAASGALRNRKRKGLTEEASRDFAVCWFHLANDVAQQYDIFHQIIYEYSHLFLQHKKGYNLSFLMKGCIYQNCFLKNHK